MNPQALRAYAAPVAAIRTPRTAEYDVIARVTQRLITAIPQRQRDLPSFLEALLRNEQLWSTLAADVAGPMNALPQSLKARLFYLYRFTTEHSQKVRCGAASAEVLVEINKAVLRGLRGEGMMS